MNDSGQLVCIACGEPFMLLGVKTDCCEECGYCFMCCTCPDTRSESEKAMAERARLRGLEIAGIGRQEKSE